jgi:hypothetical protein
MILQHYTGDVTTKCLYCCELVGLYGSLVGIHRKLVTPLQNQSVSCSTRRTRRTRCHQQAKL